MNIIKNIVLGVLAVLALLFGYLYFTSSSSPFGTVNPTGPQHFQMEAFLQGLATGAANQSSFSNTGALTLGASGTAVNNLLFGKCNVTQSSVGSQLGTTTAEFFCTAAGVKANDFIIGDMPQGAGTASGTGGFILVSAYATTTGRVEFQIENFSGAATSSFKQATTSVEYFDLR